MKNFSSNWKKWANRLACVCAVALFSMSFAACSEAYDDTELRGEIENLKDRVETIEKKLNEQVSALAELADAVEGVVGVASTSYDEATGKWTIVLSDGTALEVLADAKAEDVVSAKEAEDGKLYWAIDGEFILDGEGNKVPVVITPQVRVGENNEYEVSVDGGLSWHATGLAFEEQAPALFTEVTEDANYVYFTQANGSVLKVAKADAAFDVSMLAGKQYFAAGETKSIPMNVIGMTKYMIVKPAGWAAEIVENMLEVTAPAEGAAGAELKGKIQIMAVSESGKSTITEVVVEQGEAPVQVSIENGTAYFTVSESCKNDESWNGYIRGLRLKEEFDPQAIYDDYSYGVSKRNLLTDDFEISVEQMIANHGMEIIPGQEYVVWGFNTTVEIVDGFWGPEETILPESPENIVYAIWTAPEMKVEFTNVTFVDATMNISVKGYDKVYYMVNYFTAEDDEDKAEQLEYYKEEFVALVNDEYFWESSYILPQQYMTYSGSFDEFYYNTMWNHIAPGQVYQFLMIPANAKTIENLVSVDVTLPYPTVGTTNAAVELSNLSTDFKYAKATITPNADCLEYRFYWLSDDDVALNNTDELIVKHIYENTYQAYTDVYEAQYSNLTPEANIWLYVLAIDRNGVASITKQEFSAPALEYLESKIYVETLEVTMSSAKIKITADEDIVAYRYRNMEKSGNYGTYDTTYKDDATAEGKLATNDGYNFTDVKVADVVDNTLEFKSLTFGTEYIFFAIGLDADGNPTHMEKVVYTPGSAFMNGYDPELTAQPTITAVYFTKDTYSSDDVKWQNAAESTIADLCDEFGSPDYGMYKFDIDWGSIKMKNYWVYMGSTSYVDPDKGAYTATQSVIKFAVQTRAYGGWPEGSEGWTNYTGLRQAQWNDSYTEQIYSPQQVYIAWEDEDGNFYPYMLIDQESFFQAEGEGGPVVMPL